MWNNPSKIGFQVAFTSTWIMVLTNLAMLKSTPIFSVVIFARSRGQDAPETQKEKPLRTSPSSVQSIHSNRCWQDDTLHFSLPRFADEEKSWVSWFKWAGGNEPETHPFVSTDNLTTKHRMQVAKVAVGPWNTSMGGTPSDSLILVQSVHGHSWRFNNTMGSG